jgi:hypothetical protein
MLASSQHTLPPGIWHTSDHAAASLAKSKPDICNATHVPTGAAFRLVRTPPGKILSISAEDDAARFLVRAHWDDPTGWARTRNGVSTCQSS